MHSISDQGPYGGHLALFWEFPDTHKLQEDSPVRFAEKNGWQLLDSISANRAQTDNWLYEGKPVFPLTSAGFSGTISANTQLRYFPRRISGPIRIYRFKTKWATIQPGTDEATFENGFLAVDSSEKSLAVYHLWGE